MNILKSIISKFDKKLCLQSNKSVFDILNYSVSRQKLLDEYQLKKDIYQDSTYLLDKSKRLYNIGFGNSKEYQDSKKIKTEFEELNEVIEALNYFGNKYPDYIFVTKGYITKVCSDNDLIHRSILFYTGNVHDDKLKALENVNIQPKDEAVIFKNHNKFKTISKLESKNIEFSSYNEIANRSFQMIAYPELFKNEESSNETCVITKEVIYKDKSYYLIVDTW
jgi:hypothetical protein